jgi:SAM-dependent methyltransferase
MARRRAVMAVSGFAAAIVGIGLVRRVRKLGHVHHVPGGTVMADPAATDKLGGFFLRPVFQKVGAEIAAVAPSGGAVLDVGCGPGHLANLLASRFGLDVTGLDIDVDMIDRAEKNACCLPESSPRPIFVVGSADLLPFDDATFDVVVSTLSVHHWSDPEAGFCEIHRVLRPGGKALIWDFRPGLPFPGHKIPNIAALAAQAPFAAVSVTPYGWRWKLKLLAKTELVRS